jgi:hypothetical protein
VCRARAIMVIIEPAAIWRNGSMFRRTWPRAATQHVNSLTRQTVTGLPNIGCGAHQGIARQVIISTLTDTDPGDHLMSRSSKPGCARVCPVHSPGSGRRVGRQARAADHPLGLPKRS